MKKHNVNKINLLTKYPKHDKMNGKAEKWAILVKNRFFSR